MATKSKINISFDPVLFVIFSFITITLCVLAKTVPSIGIWNIAMTPTNSQGSFPFIFKEPLSWIRLFLYIFGTQNLSQWIYLAFLFSLFPSQESNFGTGLLFIMIILSTVFSGVLFTCFCSVPFSGCLPVIFLFQILNFITEYKKGKINLSWIFSFSFLIVFFLLFSGNPKDNVIPLFICFAGGLCGSLVSFITVKKSSRKKPSGKTKKEPETVVYFDNEADSPRFKNKKGQKNTDDDETIIGTIDL